MWANDFFPLYLSRMRRKSNPKSPFHKPASLCLFIFGVFKHFMHSLMCVCACLCTHVHCMSRDLKCPHRLEEGIDSLTKDTSDCELPNLNTKKQTLILPRTTTDLNYWEISLVCVLCFFKADHMLSLLLSSHHIYSLSCSLCFLYFLLNEMVPV